MSVMTQAFKCHFSYVIRAYLFININYLTSKFGTPFWEGVSEYTVIALQYRLGFGMIFQESSC